MNKRILRKHKKLRALEGKNFIGHFLRADDMVHLRFNAYEYRHYRRWGHPSKRNSFDRTHEGYGRHYFPLGIGNELKLAQQALLLQQGELSCWRVFGSTWLGSALQNKSSYSSYYFIEVRQQSKQLGLLKASSLGWSFFGYPDENDNEIKPTPEMIEFFRWAAPQLNLMGFNYEGKGW